MLYTVPMGVGCIWKKYLQVCVLNTHTTVIWLVLYRCQGHDDLEQPVLRLKKIEKMLTSTAIRIPSFIRVY